MTAPMTLPDDIELREELEIRLCINGCQQRTAGYNEAKQGKKGLDTDDMERMETIAVNEVMELIAIYRKKWEAEADRATIETIYAILNGDDNQVETAKAYIWNKLQALQGENK